MLDMEKYFKSLTDKTEIAITERKMCSNLGTLSETQQELKMPGITLFFRTKVVV